MTSAGHQLRSGSVDSATDLDASRRNNSVPHATSILRGWWCTNTHLPLHLPKPPGQRQQQSRQPPRHVRGGGRGAAGGERPPRTHQWWGQTIGVRGRGAGESQRQPATAYAAFSSSFHAEPVHQGKHRRAALSCASVAHKRGERPVTRCRHGDEPGRAGYGYERDSPRAPPGAAASRPLAKGSKRTQVGPCTWPAPPSPSARFLDAISGNTP